MSKVKTFAASIAGMLLLCNAFAQESFDLSSQRSESQEIPPVPGMKLEHNGLIINPVPHKTKTVPGQFLDIAAGISLKDRTGRFADDFGFLAKDRKGVRLTIDFGTGKADGVKEVSGAYMLKISTKGITITGYDERGAFYGIQTLRQIAESPACKDGKLPCLEICDYPDLPYRGVVEGFYGTPWSHEVRLSLIDFYGKSKMNCYLYGPKDDPYHSCPDWRLPYPEKEAADIKELVEACNRNRVEFVWAIHPGQDIKWNEEDYTNLVNKFGMMYSLGVRSFAIFFDDISGEGTNPARQVELLNRLNEEFVKAKGDVFPLTVCPTDYSKLWANPAPDGSLSIYGKTLDPSIKVFWTGDVVCSDLTPETLEWVNSRIRRPAFYWWNYPVTDYARHIMMQGPVYGLDGSLTSNDLSGFVSNPMEHGEASRLALYGVADYTWNIEAYNPIDNWERGLVELAGDAAGAYRTFAIHSCDTETGYRRDESWETETFRIDNFTDSQFNSLMEEFKKIEHVPAMMEAGCANKALLKELRPWLTEFGKLGTRGRKALELIKIYESGDNAAFWNAYLDNLMTQEERKAYEAHKSGTMKLQPFYENAMDGMRDGFYSRLTGQIPSSCKGIGSFANINTMQSKLMFDNDDSTYYTSGDSQKEGSWIGADLGEKKEVREINILQGRNSIDDCDYFDHAVLEYSEDGRDWTPLVKDLEKQYDIHWTGSAVEARYIRLRRLDSQRNNWASIRTFEVNPVHIEDLGFEIEAADMSKAAYAFDRNPETSFHSNGTLSFGIKPGTKEYILLTGTLPEDSTVSVRQMSADGTAISETAVTSPFQRIRTEENASHIIIEGNAVIFEIMPVYSKCLAVSARAW
ncbi:MAG: beta-N-acetylglucosaminidase domain-containing protein [Bacteroidales bacterium]|nr:beta-N-acetylglucosaminidase domain-containing protein [Bacteroidales bacterium]